FTLAAPNISVTQGSSGSSTVTVTSQNAYAGTVSFALSTTSSSLQTYGCYTIGNATVAANGTATSTLTLYTSQSACNSTTTPAGVHSFAAGPRIAASHPKPAPGRGLPLGAVAFAGLLFLGFGRMRRSVFTWLSCLCLVAFLGLS